MEEKKIKRGRGEWRKHIGQADVKRRKRKVKNSGRSQKKTKGAREDEVNRTERERGKKKKETSHNRRKSRTVTSNRRRKQRI